MCLKFCLLEQSRSLQAPQSIPIPTSASGMRFKNKKQKISQKDPQCRQRQGPISNSSISGRSISRNATSREQAAAISGHQQHKRQLHTAPTHLSIYLLSGGFPPQHANTYNTRKYQPAYSFSLSSTHTPHTVRLCRCGDDTCAS